MVCFACSSGQRRAERRRYQMVATGWLPRDRLPPLRRLRCEVRSDQRLRGTNQILPAGAHLRPNTGKLGAVVGADARMSRSRRERLGGLLSHYLPALGLSTSDAARDRGSAR